VQRVSIVQQGSLLHCARASPEYLTSQHFLYLCTSWQI
jgi:hypothetical protein